VARPRSGRNPEQGGNKGGLSRHVTPVNTPNLPLSDHRHSLVASQYSARRLETAEPETWLDQALDAPVVLLNDSVVHGSVGWC
jgi:hypothetical protein